MEEFSLALPFEDDISLSHLFMCISKYVKDMDIGRDSMKSYEYRRKGYKKLQIFLKSLEIIWLEHRSRFIARNHLFDHSQSVSLPIRHFGDEELLIFARTAATLSYQSKEKLYERVKDLVETEYNKMDILIAPEDIKIKKEINIRYPVWGHTALYVPPYDLLVIGDRGGIMYFFDAKSYKKYDRKRIHQDWVSNIKYDEKSNYIFTCSEDRTAKIFRVSKFKKIKLIYTIESESKLYCIHLLRSQGKFILSGLVLGLEIFSFKNFKKKISIFRENYGVGYEILDIKKYNILLTPWSNGKISAFDLTSWKEISIFKRAKIEWTANSLCYIEKTDTIYISADTNFIFSMKWNPKINQLTVQNKLRYEGFDCLQMVPINHQREILFVTYRSNLDVIDTHMDCVDPMYFAKTYQELGANFLCFIPKYRKLVVTFNENPVIHIYSY